MTQKRLSIRLDPRHRQRLEEIAAEKNETISDAVRRLIDDAYQRTVQERRIRAAERLVSLEVEDVPDPAQLCRELNAAHEPGGIWYLERST